VLTEALRHQDPRIGLKRHLRAVLVPGEAVYLLSSRGISTVLRGAHAETLVPLLDGTRSLAQVLDEAAAAIPVPEAGQAVAELARAQLITYHRPFDEESGQAAHAAEAYWDLAGLDGDRASRQLAALRVAVHTLGRADDTELRRACLASDLVLAEPDDPAAELSLVICEDYLDPRLGDIDREHRERGRPWLVTRLCGAEPWVGPVFRPDGPCWTCMADRLRNHRQADLLARSLPSGGNRGPVRFPVTSIPAGRTMAVHSAVLETAKWLAGMRYPGQDAVRTLDTLSMETRSHQVRRRPQCAACGDPGLVARQVLAPVRPASRPKAGPGGSNDRALPADEVWRRYRHLISPVTGIVPDIRRDHRLPEGVHGYLASANPALRSRSLGDLSSDLRQANGGKGTTAEEARLGALCEAVERYSATWHGDEPTVRDTLRGLGGAAVNPEDSLLIHPRQYADRDRWNAAHGAFQQIGEGFEPDRPAHWTPVWSLTARRQRLLPTSMLYFGAAEELGEQETGPWADSNGTAAGSSLEDAIVQGCLELVERDAVALWWYNRLRRPAVDLDAFDEPWLARAREQAARAGRTLWALDLTSDLGIPAVCAVSRLTDAPPGSGELIAMGLGAHFNPRLALRRAVTEMWQLLPGFSEPGVADVDLMRWRRHATVASEPYLLPDPGESPRTPGSYPYRPRADLRDDIAAFERLVSERGMELLVLDQTRPDLELPVVKVIVPGLRHFWARLAPGRLYDIPVELGQLSQPTRYEHLNPTPLFL
jgi:ribosomal protein S12 methylthiotransferase accessory factor